MEIRSMGTSPSELAQGFVPVLRMLADNVTPEWGAVIGASLVAAYCDVRAHRMPNWLTLPLAVAGIAYAAGLDGFNGLGESIGTWLVLALPYILLFVLGRGGAGDAKMMGAIGAWLGFRDGLVVLCCVAAIGGALGLLRLAAHRQRRTLFRNLITSLYIYGIAFAGGRRGWELLRAGPEEQAQGPPGLLVIPYGIAIFVGVCLGAVVVQLWIE
jgi:Flp pilus assembly protein protease CpaA